MVNVPELFGSMVFNDAVMRRTLSPDVYDRLQDAIHNGEHLSPDIADAVAEAMKNWAIEKGATHFTHWFQPMTGVTAEKHDSFISSDGHGGVIMEFSGKSLIKGEPDASSLPSGGLRATFEARGYTAWDPSSYAFIKDGSLCIPTAFCSYSGHSLDKKTPLLRSMEVLNQKALRILRLFGDTETKKVITTVGAEQEYFLIDRALYDRRPDLVTCKRTLFGAEPPKGQEVGSHYFGVIEPRVSEYMKELDMELWKLGVMAKTKHNETAPSQHELAPVYCTANIACDHNQLTMEMMKRVAAKHNMACILHEKPFDKINGSGKHNNWGICTDKGVNLLEPGSSPAGNNLFLLFLSATIAAVDDYQELLRASVASASNDLRLGSHEAPPAIISIYLGEELTEILSSIEKGVTIGKKKKSYMDLGIGVLPYLPKDSTDRNRTSPLAFTGNKFEFRMVGSGLSIAGPNIVLNTAVADELDRFADQLSYAEDLEQGLYELVKETFAAHKRVIFNGNSYSDEWVAEAAERGLANLRTTVDALPAYISQKSIDLFGRHYVFTPEELQGRYAILTDIYTRTVSIEAATMIGMSRQQIQPAVIKYKKLLSDTIVSLNTAQFYSATEGLILEVVEKEFKELYLATNELETVLNKSKSLTGEAQAKYIRDNILPKMSKVRGAADRLESNTPKEYWPYPSYAELLTSLSN